MIARRGARLAGRVDVVHVLPHARSLGGTERMVLDLLGSPSLNDVRQRVVFVHSGPVVGFPAALLLEPHVLVRPLGPLGVALTIARARPRVIHGWLLQGNLLGAVARLLRPASKLVTSERNLGHNLSGPKRLLERLVAALETVATANSDAVRERAVARIPRRATKIRVILPGVEPPEPPAESVQCTAAMVGRLHEVKDHATALRAWALVREAHPQAVLAIVGDGPERTRLQRLADALGLRTAVIWAGDVDPRTYLFGASVYLCTSRSEGFSRALLEALGAGVPSVSTDVGGIAELPAGAVHVVPAGDAQVLAETVRRVLADGVARAGARGLASEIRERFRPERCHDAYRNLYRELGVVG